MSVFATLLLAAVLIGNTVGQLLFKAASLRASAAGKVEEGSPTYWRLLVSQPTLWIGLVLYIAEFFIWFAFLSVVPLWQGVMVASVDILAVMVAGRVFFGEQITPARVLAVSLIAVGVLLVGWGGEIPT